MSARSDDGSLLTDRVSGFLSRVLAGAGPGDRAALIRMAAELEDDFASLVAALRERQDLLERLSKIAKGITRRANLQQTLDAIVSGAAELLDEPIAGLRLVEAEDAARMRLVSVVGIEDERLERMRSERVGEGVGGRAIQEERLVVAERYDSSGLGHRAFRDEAITTAMAAPVREQGRVVGSLVVASRTPYRRFSAGEKEMLLTFADHASLALTDARMVADAMHAAVHDALTGLPNRTLFADRVQHALERARRGGTRVAVLFVDLDRFKAVNDSFGHRAGDALLVAVADRLRGALRESDTVARLGGDEFAILLEEVPSEAAAARVAEQLAAALVRPFPLLQHDHFASASIGIALSDATADDSEALLANADTAMYRAKANGRGGYELYDEPMRERALHRLRLETELNYALVRQELELHFQPIVALADGRPTGAEALLRWRHHRHGFLPPGEFVGVAEESGLIVALGEWVLREACRHAAGWNARRPDGPPLTVAVNLSPRQVVPRLVGTVERALERSGLEPALLELEITESVLLEDADAPKEALLALRETGVRLVLDDFGTGYSSLGYLKRLPLDGLKIDRSFVSGLGTDPDDTAIVAAVTGMARGLGLTLIAEGVETAQQHEELQRLGCLRGQGLHFAAPLEPSEFTALLPPRARLGPVAPVP